MSKRLPRVRGDRPHKPGRLHVIFAAPPRTRGSTRARQPAASAAQGSPAYAGIDPSSNTPCARAARLPRVRGDRPVPPSSTPFVGQAPPRTRGSTPVYQRRRSGQYGSPAYAGIDPKKPKKMPAICGLPRVRGDRPDFTVFVVLTHKAPPRTRGSTRQALQYDQRQQGSPAYAGIDLSASIRRWSSARLPRVRGDRPSSGGAMPELTLAPPRTRGSTQQLHDDA